MKRQFIRNGFFYLIKLISAGITAIFLLSVFDLFYHYSGTHIENKTGATDYTFQSRQFKGTMEEGFAWFYEDDNGFNNVYRKNKNRPDILLMGSSHMEAAQISPYKNIGYLLNELQENYDTYNIGMPGHTIYRCVDNIENAVKTYHPDKYVIMETDRISLEMEEMEDVLSGHAQKIPSYDSGILYQLQKIAAVKWLYKSMGDWIGQKDADGYVISSEKEDIIDYEKKLNMFLALAKEASRKQELIIFYHPQQILNEDGSVSYLTNEQDLNIFSTACKRNEIIFVDMTDCFDSLYKSEHVLCHGFCNTAVGTGHLNQFGHKIIAEELSSIIDELEDK